MHALLQNMLIHLMHTWYSKHLTHGFQVEPKFYAQFLQPMHVFPNGISQLKVFKHKTLKSTDQSEQNQNHFGMVRVPNYDPNRPFLVVPVIG